MTDQHSPDQPGNHPVEPDPARNRPTIRAASPDEAVAVLDLWRRAGAAPSRTDDVESIGSIAATGALHVAVAPAGADTPIVGSLIAAWDGWRGNLYRLAVDPDHRRRGIARALVDAGEAHLRARGCVRISALVLDDVDHATGFWRAAGYEPQPEISRWTSTLAES